MTDHQPSVVQNSSVFRVTTGFEPTVCCKHMLEYGIQYTRYRHMCEMETRVNHKIKATAIEAKDLSLRNANWIAHERKV